MNSAAREGLQVRLDSGTAAGVRAGDREDSWDGSVGHSGSLDKEEVGGACNVREYSPIGEQLT
jgi:hypothetical protein